MKGFFDLLYILFSGNANKGHADLASAEFVKMDNLEEGRNIDMKGEDNTGETKNFLK